LTQLDLEVCAPSRHGLHTASLSVLLGNLQGPTGRERILGFGRVESVLAAQETRHRRRWVAGVEKRAREVRIVAVLHNY
jgi:hypothetical protein